MAKRISPIQGKPYRVPGGSLRTRVIAERDRTLDPMWFGVLWAALVCGAYVGVRAPNMAPGLLAVGLIIWPVSAYLFVKRLKRFKRMKQGLEGEQSVGVFLERLRANGALLIHDFPRGDANIDHVIVHPSGVYSVETKTWSYRDAEEREIVFNGKGVSVGGGRFYPSSVNQAKSQAAFLSDLIRESTNERLFVQPVLLFPGWTIVATEEAKQAQIIVTNPISFLEHVQRLPVNGKLDVQRIWRVLSAKSRSA